MTDSRPGRTHREPGRTQSGFTLIEVAAVVLIVGIVFGALVLPIKTQLEIFKTRETLTQLDQIRTALLVFSQREGRLPCPASDLSNGRASPTSPADKCDFQHGFVPARTLGLSGPTDAQGRLLDAWGQALRYSISAADTDTDNSWDLVVAGELRDVGMANLLAGDLLTICRDSPDAAPGSVTAPATPCAAGEGLGAAAAVFYSLGPDGNDIVAPDSLAERENASEDGTLTLGGLPVAGDDVFVARPRRDQAAIRFDDLVGWLSPYRLFERMAAAGALP